MECKGLIQPKFSIVSKGLDWYCEGFSAFNNFNIRWNVQLKGHLLSKCILGPSRPPTLTKVFNTSSTNIKVNWNPIAHGYVHGVLSGYVVLYRAMNESQDLYKDHEVGPNSTSVELTGLWKYTNYGIRVLGFTRMGWGVISPEVLVQTDEDGNVEFVLLVCC